MLQTNVFIAMLCLTFSYSHSWANSFVNNYLLQSDKRFQTSINFGLKSPVNAWNYWIEDSEIRLSSKKLSGLEDKSYGLRFKLKNQQQQAAENELVRLDTQKYKIEMNIFRLNSLHKAYHNIVNIIALKNKVELLKQQLHIAHLEWSASKNLLASGEFNPSKLQNAELEIISLDSQIEVKNKILNKSMANISLSSINNQPKQKFYNDQQWLVSIKEILYSIENQNTEQKTTQNLSLQKLELQTQIEIQQRQRAKAELGNQIRFVELEYAADKSNFGATLAVKIPFGKNNFNSVMSHNDYQQAQHTWEMQRSLLKEDMIESITSIQLYYDEYMIEKKLLSSVDTRLQRIMQTSKPELVLTLKRQRLKHKSNHQEIFIKILRGYINLLSVSGDMVKLPLRNWIQKGKPKLRG
jgi:hypothetical protein